MKSKLFLILILIILMMILSGCWNYKDIEDMVIATGMAVDKDEDSGDYLLTIEVVNNQPSGQGSESESKSVLIETEGKTIFDAMRNAIIKSGKKIFWGHCKLIIISESIAREGIIPVLDMMWRDAETRPDIWTLISKEKTAGEIYKSKSELEDIISFYLDETINSVDSIPKFVADNYMDFISKLSIYNNSVVAPVVSIDLNEDKEIPVIQGSAVFKGDKLLYFIDDDESKTALLVRNELNGGILTITENGFAPSMRISIEVFESKSKLEPVIENGKLVMNVKIEIKAGIAEMGGSDNYIEEDRRELLKSDTENMIKLRIEDLIKKTQYNSTDIFDFNGTVKRKMPDYYKTIEADWDNVYKQMDIKVDVKIDFNLSASTFKPIEIGD